MHYFSPSRKRSLSFLCLLITYQSTHAQSPRQEEVGKTFTIKPDLNHQQQAQLEWRFQPNCQSRPATSDCDPNEDVQLVRRFGFQSPYSETTIQFKDRVQMDSTTNALSVHDATVMDSGQYYLRISPSQSASYNWGPMEIDMYKRPEELLYVFSDEYHNHNQAAVAGPQKQNVATCTAKNAKPAARLQWQWDDGMYADAPRTIENEDGSITTKLDLYIAVNSDMHLKEFTCVASQPGLPSPEKVLEKTLTMNVKYKPEEMKLVLVTTNSSSNSETIKKVKCFADANPKAKFNMTLPNGSRVPTSGFSSPSHEYVVNYDTMNDGVYKCSACNVEGCTTIAKTSSELRSDKASESGIVILGLPIWLWILVIVGVSIAVGLALVFCCCKTSDGHKKGKLYSKKLKGSNGKLEISGPLNIRQPDGQSSAYSSMNSRHKLIPTRKHSDDSYNGQIVKNPEEIGIQPNVNDQLQQHFHHINASKQNELETRKFLSRSQEMLHDENLDQFGQPTHPGHGSQEIQRYTGYDEQPPQEQQPQQNMSRNNFPRASGNSHASNRPYSEHFGYGGGSANVSQQHNHSGTLPPNAGSQIHQEYASNFGYGAAPAQPIPQARSHHALHQQQPDNGQYAETTLI